MSFIGKILVVMQLVLSICLMAFAAAVSTYQTNWKAKSEALEKQKTTLDGSIRKLEEDAKTAAAAQKKELDAETAKANEAAVKVDTLQRENLTLAKTNDELRKESAQKQQLQKDLAGDNISRHEEIKLLRGQLKTAQVDRDKEYDAKEALAQEIFDLQKDNTRLSNLSKEQLKLTDQYKKVLAAKGLSPDLDEHVKAIAPAPKGLAGKVKEVMKSGEAGEVLIQITIGENDGLVKGHVLTVFRTVGKVKYLGKARVMDVRADTAVCRMLGESLGKIEKEDDVST